mmetsp:Transcript_32077/g.67441  ORF Transcript_32077/g.67441 Transcript_32077/m.67441 type:complete len:102 (-) Transcript_32077:728-1033(-)
MCDRAWSFLHGGHKSPSALASLALADIMIVEWWWWQALVSPPLVVAFSSPLGNAALSPPPARIFVVSNLWMRGTSPQLHLASLGAGDHDNSGWWRRQLASS